MIIDHPYQIPSSEKRKDIQILPFVENGVEYNSCFILLNPFYKRKERYENFESQKSKWIEEPKSKVISNYEIFTWTDFSKHSRINDIKEIFHCLYVTDHNYVERFQKVKKDSWEKFQKTIIEVQLIPNADSFLSILLINKVLLSLQKMGYEKVKLYDIWKEQEQVGFLEIQDLLKSEEEFPNEFRLITDDKKFLFYQEYELYETFIYSNDAKSLKSLVQIADFEGFFATEKTTLLWNEIEYEKDDEVINVETW